MHEIHVLSNLYGESNEVLVHYCASRTFYRVKKRVNDAIDNIRTMLSETAECGLLRIWTRKNVWHSHNPFQNCPAPENSTLKHGQTRASPDPAMALFEVANESYIRPPGSIRSNDPLQDSKRGVCSLPGITALPGESIDVWFTDHRAGAVWLPLFC
jgi:hypothetical protein